MRELIRQYVVTLRVLVCRIPSTEQILKLRIVEQLGRATHAGILPVLISTLSKVYIMWEMVRKGKHENLNHS